MSRDSISAPENELSDSGRRSAVIIRSRFNREITGSMLDGAEAVLQSAGLPAEQVHTLHVPGAFELPQAAQYAEDHLDVDGLVTIGAVIRGETAHFDYICSAATSGLREVSLRADVPLVFGVLTCETRRQARERAGLTDEGSNKGAETARALLQMWTYREKVSGIESSSSSSC